MNQEELKEIELTDRINKGIDEIKQIISEHAIKTKGVRLQSLYTAVIEGLSKNTRNTPAQIEYLSAYEQALSVFRETALELRKEMNVLALEQRLTAQQSALKFHNMKEEGKGKDDETLVRQISDAVFFSNRYALFFSGQVGLALLDSKKADLKSQYTFGSKLDSSQDRNALVSALSEVTVHDLEQHVSEKRAKGISVNDDDLKYVLEATFTSWINQFSWEAKPFKNIADRYDLGKLKLKFNNCSLHGGEFKKKYDVIVMDDKMGNNRKNDIIGNKEEFVDPVWESLLKLAGFDFDRQKNPFSPPTSIFVEGDPGCGKTFGERALIKSFVEDICKPRRIPVWAFTHNVTDYGSKYQNETPNQLAALRDKVLYFPGIVIMQASDVDTFLPTSRTKEITQEENKVNGIYFSFFDGSIIPKNGRVLFMFDANYIDAIDNAMKSRLFDQLISLKRFKTPEEFSQYARAYLTKGSYETGIKDCEWKEIGDYLLDSGLSNREMANLFTNLRGNFKVREDMLDKSFDEKVGIINDFMKGITADKVIKTCQGFIDTRMELERKSYEAKRQTDYERYVQLLQTKLNPAGTGKTSEQS